VVFTKGRRMNSPVCIEQKGIIEKITDTRALVRIEVYSACASCHAKGACGSPEGESRLIEAEITERGFEPGQFVYVEMKKAMGIKAALLAYIMPFVIVILTLLILTSFKLSELLSGTISILILIPYFSGLYLFRKSLKRSFSFTLRKAY